MPQELEADSTAMSRVRVALALALIAIASPIPFVLYLVWHYALAVFVAQQEVGGGVGSISMGISEGLLGAVVFSAWALACRRILMRIARQRGSEAPRWARLFLWTAAASFLLEGADAAATWWLFRPFVDGAAPAADPYEAFERIVAFRGVTGPVGIALSVIQSTLAARTVAAGAREVIVP